MRKVGYRKLGQCPYLDCNGGNLFPSSAGTKVRPYGHQLMLCSCGSYSMMKANGWVYPLLDEADPNSDALVAVQPR